MTLQLPDTLTYGKVIGRFVLAVADVPEDPDALPNAVPAVGTISFTSMNPLTKETAATPPTTVVRSVIPAAIDDNGYLYNPKDPTGPRGIWLVAGPYKVAYSLNTGAIAGHDILVLPEHDDETPLDLISALPPGGPILTASQYAELTARMDTLEAGSGPGGGTTDHNALSNREIADQHPMSAITGLVAALDGKAEDDDARLSDARTPTVHAASHASGGSDPVTPASIGAATPSQVSSGDTATLSAAQSYAQGLVDALTAASPATLDTLAEIADALGDDPNFAATMTAALAARVRHDAAQSLTVGEQAQARSNIGAGTSSFSGNYGDLDNKPTLGSAAAAQTTDFALATHDHDGRYYTETETDNLLAGKAPASGQFPVNTVAASGATETLPATHAAHAVVLDQNCDITFASPTAGHAFILHLSGAFTPTFLSSIEWAGGSPPTYDAGGTLYHFVTLAAGSPWLGSGQAYS